MANDLNSRTFTIDEVSSLITELNFDHEFMAQLQRETNLMPKETMADITNLLQFMQNRFRLWLINKTMDFPRPIK
jgi:hypothetical protein